MAETPSLPDVLEAGIDRRLEGVHTATPGTIVFYSDGLATVLPNNGAAAHQQVPVAIPGAWAPGDPVLIVYCEREFDADLEDAGEERRHGVGGPIAVPLISRPGDVVDFVALAGLVNQRFADLAQAFVDWIPVANDGGAALKTELSALISGGWPEDVSATKVKAR